MIKKKKNNQKVLLEYIIYNKKNIHQKKWTRTHKNKDGSYSSWGVTRNGNRYKKVAYKPKSEKDINKSFKKIKKLKSAKNNVSLKLQIYEGRYYGKSGKISGELRFLKWFKIGKRSQFKVKQKLFLRESKVTNIIDTINNISEVYDLAFF